MLHRSLVGRFAPQLMGALLAGLAQAQELTSVDLYGVRTVDPSAIRSAIGVTDGDMLTEGTAAIVARVEALEGVAQARAAVIQYPGHVALFVGVRETGASVPALRPAPAGDVTLDPELMSLHDRHLEQLVEAIRAGEAGEDHEDGYALSQYRPMREIELIFVEIATPRFDELRNVLRHARDDQARAAAATILGYGRDKVAIAAELELAATDPHDGVRNNAVRALSILAEYAQKRPDLELEIDPGPFLNLLRSLEWTDRNKGSFALDSLTRGREPKLLARLVDDYLPELEEMALWKSTGHAFSSLRVLARLAGRPEASLIADIGDPADMEARRAWVDDCILAIQRVRRAERSAETTR